jgi:hypothetical protein
VTVFLQFLADYAPFIYGAIALVAIYLIRRALLARRERTAAIFPLEREVAVARTYRTFGIAFLLIIILLATWGASNLLLPTLQDFEGMATPTPDLLVLIDTPTPTSAPPTATPTITPTPQPRPTRKPPAVEVTTAPPTPPPPQCPNPAAAITSPGSGQIATNEVVVTGTANIDGFQFYKLEWLGPANPQQWNWFAGSERPVSNAVLGALNVGGFAPGTYTVRLVVVDGTGNYPPPCTVQIIVP